MVLLFKTKHYDLSIQCSKLQKEKKKSKQRVERRNLWDENGPKE